MRSLKLILAPNFLSFPLNGIITKKEIQSIQELDGKKIGVLRASTLDIFCEMFAEKYNISLEQIYFRTPVEMATALQRGEVDALSYYVPSIFRFNEDFHIFFR